VATVRKAYGGLLSNRITALVDDGEFAYVGTDKGLSVIDTYTYTVQNIETDLPINRLLRVSGGDELWAATDNGVFKFDVSNPAIVQVDDRYTTADGLYADRVVDMVELNGYLWLAYAQDFSASAPVVDKLTKFNISAKTGVDYATRNYGTVNQTVQLFTYGSLLYAVDNYCVMEINPADGAIIDTWFMRQGAPNSQVVAVATQNGADLWLAYTDLLNETNPFITRFDASTFMETDTFQLATEGSVYGVTTGALTWGDGSTLWGADHMWGGVKTTVLPSVNDMFAQYIPQFISVESMYLAGEDYGAFDSDWGACLWLGLYLSPGVWGMAYVITPEQWTPALTAVEYEDVPEASPGIIRAEAGSRLLATNDGLLVWEGTDFALFVKDLEGIEDEQDVDDPQQEDPTGGPDEEPGVEVDVYPLPPLAWASEADVRELGE
jgi:hypothetical protein